MLATGIVGLLSCATIELPDGRAFPPCAVSTAWLTKNEANAVSSATTKITAAMTMPLAANTVVRRGMVARVVLIEPVAHSEVTISAPRTPTTNWEMNSPVWENRTGSNWARSTTPRPAHRPASMLVTSAESPIPATTTTARAIHVDRTEHIGEPAGLGRAHEHGGHGVGPDEVVDGRVGDQLAPADHDEVGGGKRHLAHQVTRDEDRPALAGQGLEQVADPEDPLG